MKVRPAASTISIPSMSSMSPGAQSLDPAPEMCPASVPLGPRRNSKSDVGDVVIAEEEGGIGERQ